MRWTPLLLAAACTHPQPPPPPLGVPPQMAAEPAPPAPAGGAAAPAPDLVSPITASGVEQPVGLDWGPMGEQPAAQIFKNVKVLGALTGNRFMAGMQSMRANLSEKCDFCHEVEKKDFPADTKPTKLRAREMIRMNEEMNRRTFAGKVRVTCWTCHRGLHDPEDPAAKAPTLGPDPSFPPLSSADAAKPAERVFKDIRQLKGVRAGRVGGIMSFFARELGVKCTHCHVENDFAADKKEKLRAREMLAMTSYVADGYYEGKSPIHCGTCHRGKPEPPRTPNDTP